MDGLKKWIRNNKIRQNPLINTTPKDVAIHIFDKSDEGLRSVRFPWSAVQYDPTFLEGKIASGSFLVQTKPEPLKQTCGVILSI